MLKVSRNLRKIKRYFADSVRCVVDIDDPVPGFSQFSCTLVRMRHSIGESGGDMYKTIDIQVEPRIKKKKRYVF